MKIFELKADPKRYCNFALADASESWIYDDAFNGRPLAAEWKTLRITAADEDDATAELPDFALLGIVPVFSLRAMDALLDMLRAAGELLPLRHPRAEYVAFNVTRVIDALDEARSTILRFTDGNVMSVSRYAFLPERVRGLPILKIPELPKAYVFVSEDFVRRVSEAGLSGFHFKPLWEG